MISELETFWETWVAEYVARDGLNYYINT